MNILLLGSGGREHAIAWKIAQSPKVCPFIVDAFQNLFHSHSQTFACSLSSESKSEIGRNAVADKENKAYPV